MATPSKWLTVNTICICCISCWSHFFWHAWQPCQWHLVLDTLSTTNINKSGNYAKANIIMFLRTSTTYICKWSGQMEINCDFTLHKNLMFIVGKWYHLIYSETHVHYIIFEIFLSWCLSHITFYTVVSMSRHISHI